MEQRASFQPTSSGIPVLRHGKREVSFEPLGEVGRQMVRAIGLEATLVLLSRRGGLAIILAEDGGTELAQIIGPDKATRLARQFGSGTVTLPFRHLRGALGRRSLALHLLLQGRTASEVAQLCDCSARAVYNYRRALRPHLDPATPRQQRPT